MLQFLSAFLCDGTPVALCIYKLLGWCSFEDVQKFDGPLSDEMRRILVATDLWVWLRLYRKLNQWPWKLLPVADRARTMQAKLALAMEF